MTTPHHSAVDGVLLLQLLVVTVVLLGAKHCRLGLQCPRLLPERQLQPRGWQRLKGQQLQGHWVLWVLQLLALSQARLVHRWLLWLPV